jgi:hypothetical protein
MDEKQEKVLQKITEELGQLDSQLKEKNKQIEEARKEQASLAFKSGPSERERKLTEEFLSLSEVFKAKLKELQNGLGMSDEMLQALEDAELPQFENRFWRDQMPSAPATGNLYDLAPVALERVLKLVDPMWLQSEAQKSFRLDERFLQQPLHLVNGRRFDLALPPSPQRFARMILLCRDFVEGRENIDFFAAALLVPELVALALRLDEIRDLGPEAARKVQQLSKLPDDEVASSIHELLVGAGAVAKGRKIEMLAPDKSGKTPDLRVHDYYGLPVVIECKRRIRLSEYETTEASHASSLYLGMRDDLRKRGAHISVEADFKVPITQVSVEEFRQQVLATFNAFSTTSANFPWGILKCELLEYAIDLPGPTRLYAPNMLERVFGWPEEGADWDGLVCEIEPPSSIRLAKVRDPLCLKWRSTHPEAIVKKTKEVTSLYNSALSQIPHGEMGLIYLAYQEGSRAALADARTRNLIDNVKQKWLHEWTKRIPLVVISRLYARPLGVGQPDLIENSIPAKPDYADKIFMAEFPTNVFTL